MDLLYKTYIAYLNSGYCTLTAYAMAINDIGSQT